VAPDDGGSWAVVDGPREVAGARPPAWELVLAPLRVGELPLPTLAVTVRGTDSEERSVTSDPSTTIEVASVLPEDGEAQPLPMRAPIGVGGFPWEYVVPLVVPVIVLAAALSWWARRKRSSGAAGATPDLPPLPELERLLDRLETRLGREPSAAICDRLASGMRRYLARQSGEPAEDMTSFELRLLARRAGWSEAARRGLQEIMGLADRVRFGRAATDESSLRAAIGLAREAARDIDVQLAADTIEEAAG
jgi:hypothetical protein